jgi:hypothetical protein
VHSLFGQANPSCAAIKISFGHSAANLRPNSLLKFWQRSDAQAAQEPLLLRSPYSLLVLIALALGALPALAQSTTASEANTCPGGVATVSGANSVDFSDVCAGVTSALKFLSIHQVIPTEPVAIEVTQNLPREAGPTAVGCYIEARRRVYMVPYSKFRKAKTWFGVPINRELFRAVASHEAAHAVGACHFKIPNPTIQAKEYLAYVTMFSVMPTQLRQQALRKVKTEGFSTLDRFTPLLYSFDPMRFGAEAYRHFAAATDQTAIIQGLLVGTVLQD